jgi:hypothetical protein
MGLAGAETKLEQVVPGLVRTDGTAGRTDVDAHFDGRRGDPPVCLRSDVAVVHPAAASYVHSASRYAGATASTREKRKTTRYAVACQPDRFYGAIAETGGRISDGFVALLLTLATICTSAAAGFDELPTAQRDAAIAFRLARFYDVISVGTRRAVYSSLRMACTRICSLTDTAAFPSQRSRRTALRGRPGTRSQLLTSLPSASSW